MSLALGICAGTVKSNDYISVQIVNYSLTSQTTSQKIVCLIFQLAVECVALSI